MFLFWTKLMLEPGALSHISRTTVQKQVSWSCSTFAVQFLSSHSRPSTSLAKLCCKSPSYWSGGPWASRVHAQWGTHCAAKDYAPCSVRKAMPATGREWDTSAGLYSADEIWGLKIIECTVPHVPIPRLRDLFFSSRGPNLSVANLPRLRTESLLMLHCLYN